MRRANSRKHYAIDQPSPLVKLPKACLSTCERHVAYQPTMIDGGSLTTKSAAAQSKRCKIGNLALSASLIRSDRREQNRKVRAGRSRRVCACPLLDKPLEDAAIGRRLWFPRGSSGAPAKGGPGEVAAQYERDLMEISRNQWPVRAPLSFSVFASRSLRASRSDQ